MLLVPHTGCDAGPKEVYKGGTYPWRQVAQATEICMVASSVCRSLVWNLFDVALLAPSISRWHQHFWKICGALGYYM